MNLASQAIWERALAALPAQTERTITTLLIDAQARRARARYDTGSISRETALLLRAVSLQLRPAVAIEIGTFIGASTLAIAAGHVYTCDGSNDCLESTPTVTCHPFTKSRTMLRRLLERGIRAELFFFDGRIRDEDVPMIQRMARPGAVFLFDDYEPGEKGAVNIDRLSPHLQGYELLEPFVGFADRTTLAALWPKDY